MANRFARAGVFAFLLLPLPGAAAPARAQEIGWDRERRGSIRAVLENHYNRQLNSDAASTACRVDRGDTCFGGDHWDVRCLRVVPCRSTAAVRQFITELQRVGTGASTDPMAVAHAVYGLARLGQLDLAVGVAEQCATVAWWCDLVRGMAYQRAGLSADADTRYRAALLNGEEELVCLLTDITQLLEGRDGATYRRLPCPGRQRSQFEDRFWWLSDPMLTRPGNDRWTEHVTRRFELVLDGRLGGRGDHRRMIDKVTLRGHPDSWSRGRQFDLWKSDRGAAYRFVPASLVGDGFQALHYELESHRWVEGYTPVEYGPVFEVRGQVARFLEDDSLVLAVGADLDDAPFDPVDIRFVASGGPDGALAGLGGTPGDQGPVFTVKVEPIPFLVAVEAFGERGDAARMRHGVLPLPTDGIALSDPVLVDPGDAELPASRDEAVAAMLPQPWVGFANRAVTYWEVYGLGVGEMMEISVQLQREGRGLLTRVLGTLGGRTGEAATEVSWTEPATGPLHAMAMTVDISEIEAGDYDLRIRVTRSDGSAATTVRRVRLGPR